MWYETQVSTPGVVILSIALGYKHTSSINKKLEKLMNLPKEIAKKKINIIKYFIFLKL